jgi:S1-C subfamily serine protease
VLGRNRIAGAEVIDVRPELAGYFEVTGGVLLVDVPAGTLAAAAGLRPGDVIVELADQGVESVRDLRMQLAQPGDALEMWIIRHGDRVRLVLAGR